MRGLRTLQLNDLLALVAAVAAGNAVTVALFALLGVSDVPPDAGIVGLAGSFLAVVVGLTVIPGVAIAALMWGVSRSF